MRVSRMQSSTLPVGGQVTGHLTGEEILHHDRVLSVGDELPGNIAGEDIQHDVEIVPVSFPWSFPCADIPASHLTGPCATSSGRTWAEWVTCVRRSRLWPASRAMRYLLDSEHQSRPSSSSRALSCAIIVHDE